MIENGMLRAPLIHTNNPTRTRRNRYRNPTWIAILDFFCLLWVLWSQNWPLYSCWSSSPEEIFTIILFTSKYQLMHVNENKVFNNFLSVSFLGDDTIDIKIIKNMWRKTNKLSCRSQPLEQQKIIKYWCEKLVLWFYW